MGQLRFRITDSDDPASFAKGKDLTLPDGLPWYTYPRNRRHANPPSVIWNLLVQDGFIPEISGAYGREVKRGIGPSVSHFGELFVMDFSRSRMVWKIVSETKGRKEFYKLYPLNPLRPHLDKGKPIMEVPMMYEGIFSLPITSLSVWYRVSYED